MIIDYNILHEIYDLKKADEHTKDKDLLEIVINGKLKRYEATPKTKEYICEWCGGTHNTGDTTISSIDSQTGKRIHKCPAGRRFFSNGKEQVFEKVVFTGINNSA